MFQLVIQRRKKEKKSVRTGQIRQAQGLASEDLIGCTLAADRHQLSLKRKKCQQETGGNHSYFFQESVIVGVDDIIFIFIIITGGGGDWENLSIICSEAVTLFHRPLSLVA